MTIDRLFKGLTVRMLVIAFCFGMLLCLLWYRLWYEQLRLGSVHQTLISKQSIRRVRIPPSRGRIVSSDGQLFTDNLLNHHAIFHLHELRESIRPGEGGLAGTLLAVIDDTARLIGRTHTIALNDIRRHFRVYPAIPFRAFSDLTPVEVSILLEQIPRIPGLEIATSMQRIYPFGVVGAHAIGFVGNKDPSTETDRAEYSYFFPELTGRTGLEQEYDSTLRGEGGAMLVCVDSMGFFHEERGNVEPARAGDDLILTITSRAQRLAQQLLNGQKGAFVVVDCNTGAILALASSPTYDLNQITSSYYASLAVDRDNLPLLNRALLGGYAPGSIVKPLIALSLLQEGAYTPDEPYQCLGYAAVGNGEIGCARHSGPAFVTLVDALKGSCNSYFIAGALRVGIDQIMMYLYHAGIGQDLGLELKTRGSAGILPGRRVKNRRSQGGWTAFDTALVAIGQGPIAISPLHAAMYTAAIANGGTVWRPRLVRGTRSAEGRYADGPGPTALLHFGVPKEILDAVRAGMVQVVAAGDGTGHAAWTSVIELAGKTGTAEVGSRQARRNNAWFVCYGPVDAPRYALAILIENGLSGGHSAAPLARQFFEEFLRQPELGSAAIENSRSIPTVRLADSGSPAVRGD